jgi:hypothetical protein
MTITKVAFKPFWAPAMLRLITHVMCSEEQAQESAKKFESEDIGDILAQRTSKRIMRGGGKAGGGTFSVASFRADDGTTNGIAPRESSCLACYPERVDQNSSCTSSSGMPPGTSQYRCLEAYQTPLECLHAKVPRLGT